jgi:hypothetical protein
VADLIPLYRGAELSACGKYRLSLTRQLSPVGELTCLFIMLNPSTADADVDDPTIRKCMKFARSWGFHWLHVVNLFSYRATSPADMKVCWLPVGLGNDDALRSRAAGADLIVCAWGKHGRHRNRCDAVRQSLADYRLHYLQLNKDGSPKHPLYVKDSTQPTLWISE